MRTIHHRPLTITALRVLAAVGVCLWLCVTQNSLASAANSRSTVLGIDGTRFTLNGQPTFVLGISYYAALGAPDDFVRRDLDDMQRYGFNWLRVWVTWDMFDHNISAVDEMGEPREPFFGRLKWLMAECDRRGMVVDVTLSRGVGGLSDFGAHRRAVQVIVERLKPYRNWYLDLGNERDVRDARHVPADELKKLRTLVRRLDPDRLVTASFGGHDLSEREVRESLMEIGLDFLAPHRPRHPSSPAQTESQTKHCLALAEQIGRPAPVHYQEPFRRGYGRWQPTAQDFLLDLRGAVTGGAAGWCFHNGAERSTPDKQPRRSFDLRRRRLFDRLDEEERRVVESVAGTLRHK